MKKILLLLALPLISDVAGVEYQYSPKLNHIASPRTTMNLCGEWDFRALPKKANAPVPGWSKVRVPHSDFTQKNHGNIKELQYRKIFTAPEFENREVFLRFESVPGTSETFLNGQKIGLHHPGGVGFSYEISKLLKKGKNELEVRISYRSEENTNHRPYEHIWAIWSALGLSQPLYLEIHNPVYIEDITITTVCKPENVFSADVVLKNDTAIPKKITLNASVAKEWNLSQSVEIPAQGKTNVRFSRKWDQVKYWTPSTPNLYFLDLNLKEGKNTLDAYRQRFGFREIRIEKDKLLMNGHPFLVRRDTCVGDENAYPSDAAVREIARRYKSRGINGLRIAPRKMARWAEIADEEGLMISTIPNLKTGAGSAADDFWPNMTEYLLDIVKNYKNHPSIVCWGIANEFGSVYNCQGKEKTVIPKHQSLGLAVEKADPTRPWTSYGDIEVGFPVRGPGPAKIRSFHYPMPPTIGTDSLPELAYWYSKGKQSWQGISSKDKPLSISEDLYHGLNDQFFGISKWANDSFFTPEGYTKAWFDAVRMYAEGYYDAGIAAWEIWVAFPAEKYNKLYEYGQLIPDYLIALRESYPNLWSGTTEKRNIAVYNRTFLEQDCELIRKDTVDGKSIFAKTWKFKLTPGGDFRTVTDLAAPKCSKATTLKSEYILKSGGTILTQRVYEYNVFPESKFKLPENVTLLTDKTSPLYRMVTPEQCVESAADAVKRGKPIILHKILNSNEGRILNAFTANGGKVLLLEADEKSWTPSGIEFRKPQSFVWRRNDNALPGVTESMLKCWKPDTRLGESGYIKDPAEAVEVLLDSGHTAGLTTAHLLRLYNGKGFWMLCQLPLLSRIELEPAAPFVLEQTVAEFMKDVKKTKHLTLFAEDPFLPMLKNEHFVLDSKPDADSVFAVDAFSKIPDEKVETLKKHAQNGGSVLLLGISDHNKSLLNELGVTLSPLKECEWVIRKHNSGILAGISNDDLFFTNLKPTVNYFKAPILNLPQNIRLNSNILTGTLAVNKNARGTILTDPGAVAEIPFGKGRFIVTSLDWNKTAKSFPKKTFFTLRTLLLNLGANTAEIKKNLVLSPFEMRWSVNRQFWNDPKKADVPAWFENGNDMRYFPVNLCGWSPDSNNYCPVEAFPKDPMNFGGIKFKLSDPKGKFTGALVIAPGETKTFIFWSRGVVGFHFLGALEKSLKEDTPVLDVSYGYRYKEQTGDTKKTEFRAGDHLNIYRWSGKVKSGKVAWVGPTQLDKTGALYTWYMPSEFRSDAMISYMDLKNVSDSSVAIVALTLEKEDKK